jgi:hypothetical protein
MVRETWEVLYNKGIRLQRNEKRSWIAPTGEIIPVITYSFAGDNDKLVIYDPADNHRFLISWEDLR